MKQNKFDPMEDWYSAYKYFDKNMFCGGIQFDTHEDFIYNANFNGSFYIYRSATEALKDCDLDNCRIFKVMALMPYSQYIDDMQRCFQNKTPLKSIATSIQLTCEVPYEEYIKEVYEQYPMITLPEEIIHIKDYHEFARSKFIQKLVNLGFSETFAIILLDDKQNKLEYKKLLDYVSVLCSEGLSKDMLVYLILQKIK